MRFSFLMAAVGTCLLIAGITKAAESNVYWRVDLNQGSYVIGYGQGDTQDAAWRDCFRLRSITRAMTSAETRKSNVSAVTTQAVRWCKNPMQLATVRPDPATPPPPACQPAPADRRIDCPTGYTGTWTQRAEVGPLPTCTITWSPIAFPPDACTVVNQPPPSRALFSDRFEYDVGRSVTNAEQLFAGSGWSGVKANNSNYRRGDGYVFTRQDAILGSRVLVLESRPQDSPPPAGFPYSQTDYYVQRGSESGGVAIPANAWIQFWTYATPESRFSTRDKTIYPCRGSYPCHPTWLFMWGAQGFEESSAPTGGRFLALEGEGADRDTRINDGMERRLFQNASRTPLLAGRWYQIRLHLDISGSQGVYEAWIKERGQAAFTKVADWRGGVTPNFTWPLPTSQRLPYNIVRMPTTVNVQNNTVYIDDFIISESEAAL